MNIKTSNYSYNILFKAAILLLILSILDSIFTDFGIRRNHISEANPLMRIVLATSLPSFYVIKIGLPLLFMLVLTKLQPKKYIQLLVLTTLILYTIVLIQHIFWLSHI